MEKMYTSLLVLLLLLLFTASCHNLKELQTNKILDASNPTVLTPDTGLFKEDSMWPDSLRQFKFSYRDLHGLKDENILLRPGVESKLYIDAPTYLTEFRAGYPYLVYPGEHIDASLEPDEYVSYSIKGNEKRNNELKCLKVFHDKTRGRAYSFNTYRPGEDTSLAVLIAEEKERKSFAPSVIQNRLKLLDSLGVAYAISQDFKNVMINQVRADSIVSAIYFYKHHEKIYTEHQLADEKLNALLSVIKTIREPKDLVYYYAALDYMFEVLIAKDGIKRVIRQDADFTGQFEIVSAKFESTGRNYLLSKIMYDAIIKDIPSVNSYAEKYQQICSDDIYRKIIEHQLYLKGKIVSNVNANNGNTLLGIDSKKKFSLESVYAKNKGNVILVDFWASWCAPCREEFPQARSLKEEYAGKKFKMFYISLDRDIPRWAKASYLENIEAKNSFLLLNVNDSKIVKEFEVHTIPRYMLIGRDGKVISADAPRPSDPKLRKMIEESL